MKTKLEIKYSAKARKFLKHNPNRLTTETVDFHIEKVVRKLTGEASINVDVIKMKGRSKGKYRLRTGDIRIVFSIKQGIVYVVLVEDIDFRGDVYKLRESEAVYHTKRSGESAA